MYILQHRLLPWLERSNDKPSQMLLPSGLITEGTLEAADKMAGSLAHLHFQAVKLYIDQQILRGNFNPSDPPVGQM